MTGHLDPNRDQIEQFVDAVLRYRGSEGYLSLRVFKEADRAGLFSRMWTVKLNGTNSHQFIVDVAEDLARRAANHPEPAVFCPATAVYQSASGWQAREEDLFISLALVVECDQHPEEARRMLQEILSPATVIIRSGGQWINPEDGVVQDKLHLYWRLKKAAEKTVALGKLKEARAFATAIVGGDPTAISSVHGLRWPGSWHRKSTPRLAEIVSIDANQEIDLDAAYAALKAVAPPPKDPKGGDEASGKHSGGALDWTKAFGDIISGESFHPSLAPLAASFAARGTPEPVALTTLSALLRNTQTTDPARLVRRDTELKKLRETVRSGFVKFERKPAGLFDPWERFIVPEFPLHVLPTEIAQYVSSQSVIIGCDLAGLAMSVLTAFSGAIDHRTSVKMMRSKNSNWWEHPRLWTLLVAPPSGKKTPTINEPTGPLENHQLSLRHTYEKELEVYEQAKAAGDKSAVEPDLPVRYVVWDTTPEKLGELLTRSEHGMLVKRDEFSGWIGSMEKYNSSKGAGADRSFWLKAYDGGAYSHDRIGRGEIYIPNLSVSLIGGVQPAKLAELIGLTSDGLLQRFLPVMLRSATLAVDADNSDDRFKYKSLAYELIRAKHQRFFFSDDALATMEELRGYLHKLEHAVAGMADGFQGFVGKLPGVAGRLAVILHMIHNNPKNPPHDVAVEIARKTQTLIVDFIIGHAIEFYRSSEEASGGERLRKIASWILTSKVKELTARDLVRSVRCLRNITVEEVCTQVSPLVAGGWLEPKERSPLNRTWTVSSLVATQFERQRQIEEERKTNVIELMRSIRKK